MAQSSDRTRPQHARTIQQRPARGRSTPEERRANQAFLGRIAKEQETKEQGAQRV